jgi:hypothetical protein
MSLLSFGHSPQGNTLPALHLRSESCVEHQVIQKEGGKDLKKEEAFIIPGRVNIPSERRGDLLQPNWVFFQY